MLAFLRRLFGICSHDWRFERKRVMNEFRRVIVEEKEYDVPALHEYSAYTCQKCHKRRFSRVRDDG